MIDYLDTGKWLHEGSDEAIAAAPRARELRRADRAAVVGTAALLAEGGRRLEVTLRDASCFGLGLISDEALEPGSQWRVQLPGGQRAGSEPRVSVRYCRPERSRFAAGLQFCIGGDVLRDLGAPGDAAAA